MSPNAQPWDAGAQAWKWNESAIPAFPGASGSGSEDVAGTPGPATSRARQNSRTPLARRFAPEDGDDLIISITTTIINDDDTARAQTDDDGDLWP